MRPSSVLSLSSPSLALVFFFITVHSLALGFPRSRTGHGPGASPPQGVTKVQMEDLDEGTGCVRLRELDYCGRREGQPTWARYPNALGHTSEGEAKASAIRRGLARLMNDPTCERSLRPFLCAALTPECVVGGDDSPAALPPCRSLCEAAVEGCERAVRGRGLGWPVEWECGRFPREGVCVDRPIESNGEGGGFDRRLTDLGGRTQLDWSRGHSIESRGSLEPPPSSAIDEGLLALEDDTPRRPGNAGRRPPPNQASGDPRLFRGWADVQGIGSANDYCRILGTLPNNRFLSCALNGTGSARAYVSKRGFDVGHPGSWFMRDSDADGRDDYCRCVGKEDSHLICMKAGENGFYGGLLQPGSEYTFRFPSSSALTTTCGTRNNALGNERHTETLRFHGNKIH